PERSRNAPGQTTGTDPQTGQHCWFSPFYRSSSQNQSCIQPWRNGEQARRQSKRKQCLLDSHKTWLVIAFDFKITNNQIKDVGFTFSNCSCPLFSRRWSGCLRRARPQANAPNTWHARRVEQSSVLSFHSRACAFGACALRRRQS